MSYIECKNLTLGYEGKAIYQGIDFTVNKGDYLCIVGENGVGKSTLMKTLLNLRKPMSGEIIRGDGLNEYEIGYLPQQTVVQKDFPASVYEVVLSGCLNRCGIKPFYSSKEKKLCCENMKKMGIYDLKNTCYRDLSGGQQQRVLLARALCAAGKVLLLDEPVTGLDPKVTVEMYELIKSLNKEGITIIMISHDIKTAIDYSTHILHMDNKEAFFGLTKDYLKSKKYMSFMVKEGESDE